MTGGTKYHVNLQNGLLLCWPHGLLLPVIAHTAEITSFTQVKSSLLTSAPDLLLIDCAGLLCSKNRGHY